MFSTVRSSSNFSMQLHESPKFRSVLLSRREHWKGIEMKTILYSILFPLILAGTAWASSVDDVIALNQKGISADIMVSYVDRNPVGTLTADDIGRLKDASVPDTVIVEMLRRNGGTAEATHLVTAEQTTVESP